MDNWWYKETQFIPTKCVCFWRTKFTLGNNAYCSTFSQAYLPRHFDTATITNEFILIVIWILSIELSKVDCYRHTKMKINYQKESNQLTLINWVIKDLIAVYYICFPQSQIYSLYYVLFLNFFSSKETGGVMMDESNLGDEKFSSIGTLHTDLVLCNNEHVGRHVKATQRLKVLVILLFIFLFGLCIF